MVQAGRQSAEPSTTPPGSTSMKFFRLRFPTFSTVSSVQSRTLFLFLLLSGAIVLALSSVIERPHDTHAASGDAHGATTTDGHAGETTDDHAAVETNAANEHAAETETTDDPHAAEDSHVTEPAHPTGEAHGTVESHAVEEASSSDSHAAEVTH